jgi:hypothetical protein
MKILILGHGRHGKDTVADIMAEDYGLRSISSSMIATREVVEPYLEENHGLLYETIEGCYEDRVNHRQKWFDAISEFNRDDLARLTKMVLEVSDIYVGLRCDKEFYAARHLFDWVVGVTAFKRKPDLDPTFLAPLSECDFILTNDGPEAELRPKVHELMEKLLAL